MSRYDFPSELCRRSLRSPSWSELDGAHATQPASNYGAHKVRMEEALRGWSDLFPNHSCLIGRISSLYGPGQNLNKAEGVISHLSRCLIYHQPVSIYVPLDT